MNTRILYGLVAVICVGLGLGLAWQRTAHQAPASATVAPDPVATLLASQMQDVTGQAQALSQWQGKPLIINFWASWCTPCVKEMPELLALSKELGPKGIHVIGIGVDNAANIGEFAQKHHIDYPLLVADAAGAELSHQLGNTTGGLPFTVLIDKAGKIKRTYLGLLNFDQLRRDIAQEFN